MDTNLFESLKTATADTVKELATSGFYTTRRDAADALADSAVMAATALRDTCADPDVDVSRACRDNIERLRKTLDMKPSPQPVKPQKPAVEPHEKKADISIKDMMRAVASAPGRSGRPTSDGYVISCKTDHGRQQKVYIRTGRKDKSGAKLVQVYSFCGPADEKIFRWALETNSQMLLGALSVIKQGGTDMFVLINTHLESDCNQHELDTDVAYIATTADWIEKHITGTDQY